MSHTEEPQIAVRVSRWAVARICAELRDVAEDGLETGGFLFALRGEDKIDWACGLGANAKRTATEVVFDLDYVGAFDQRLAEQWGQDSHLAGRWHSHPDDNREPSTVDAEGAALSLSQLETAFGEGAVFLDLIVTAPRSWDYPEFTAYVYERDPITRMITRASAKFEEAD